jgi:hypothetical protein
MAIAKREESVAMDRIEQTLPDRKRIVTATCALLAAIALSPLPAQENANDAAPQYSVEATPPYSADAASAPIEFMTADLLRLGVDENQLKPGEFLWLPAAQEATGAPLMIIVNLRAQRAYVYRDGQPIAITTVSTGRPGRETPTGTYEILQKERMHHSNLYDDAPMPFMQRLTWGGVALHAGRLPGHPASHGCIRLPAKFAEQLYQMTERGQIVVVSDDGSVEALARAGLDTQFGLLAGTVATIHQLVGAVGPAPAVQSSAGQSASPAIATDTDTADAAFYSR